MKINRKRVYNKYNGHCAYCGKEITINQMQVDHLWPKSLRHFIGANTDIYNDVPNIKNIDDFDNLMPSCRKCNNFKGGMRLELFRSELSLQVSRLRKNAQFDRALRFNQIKIIETPIVFYFEITR